MKHHTTDSDALGMRLPLVLYMAFWVIGLLNLEGKIFGDASSKCSPSGALQL
jgi:hypothetical protein